MDPRLMILPRGWLGDEGFTDEAECSCGLTRAPNEFHHRSCDRTSHPYLDEESLTMVLGAVESLACLRGAWPGDAGAVLSCLASLVAEAQSRLPDATADARDRGATWAEIAARLATTASTARRRYGDYARWRAGLADQGA